MKAKQEIRVGLDTLRTRVAAHRPARSAALANAATRRSRCKSSPRPLRRRTAADASCAQTAEDHPLAQTTDKAPSATPPIRRTPENYISSALGTPPTEPGRKPL